MTDSQIIAVFMGEPLKFMHDTGTGVIERSIDYDGYYHKWENLMPVVEKIETMYDTGICYDGHRQPDVHNIRIYAKRGGSETIVVSYGTSKIETTYKAVVEFIKWYNSQK